MKLSTSQKMLNKLKRTEKKFEKKSVTYKTISERQIYGLLNSSPKKSGKKLKK